MSHVIRIDAEVFAWLQSLADPLRDNPNSVLRRVAKLPPLAHQRPMGQQRPGALGIVKLEPNQVIEIREKYATGKITQSKLAREYEVSTSNIHMIVHGLIWSHLPGPIAPTQYRRSQHA